MADSKTNTLNRDEVLAAVRAIPAKQDFVWDGRSENERPATAEELNAALLADRAKRGCPAVGWSVSVANPRNGKA